MFIAHAHNVSSELGDHLKTDKWYPIFKICTLDLDSKYIKGNTKGI